MPTYDVATRPWVHVRPLDGSPPTQVGLTELYLNAHEYADAELTLPPATAGLWRLLAVIGARITGLDQCVGLADFSTRRSQLLNRGHFDPEEVRAYLTEETAGRWDLFDPRRPWCQDPRLGGAEAQSPKTSGINKLYWGRPAGNTQVWLNHTSDTDPRPVPTAVAVHHLVATLYYGASGTCTSRTANGVKAANTSAGPLRSCLSFHPVGRNLFESIVLNIPRIEEAAKEEEPETPWERAELRDPTLPPEPPVGVAGRLTNQFRHAVLLHPSEDGSAVVDATVTWGTRAPKGQGAAPRTSADPYQIHWFDEDTQPRPRRADADRAVWRDVDALLQDHEDEGRQNSQRPRILKDLSVGIGSKLLGAVKVRAFGFEQDGQARDRQWFTATTPEILHRMRREALTPEEGEAVESALRRIRGANRAAEARGWNLESALDRVWRDSGLGGGGKPDQAPWTGRGMSDYWSESERLFWRIVDDDGSDGPGNEFLKIALKVFDRTTGPYRHRPRVAVMAQRHRTYLLKHWKRT